MAVPIAFKSDEGRIRWTFDVHVLICAVQPSAHSYAIHIDGKNMFWRNRILCSDECDGHN